MSGFAAIYRDACDHPLFAGDSSRLGAWVWLVVKAAWKPTKHNIAGKTVVIERGQIAVSIRGLAAEWGWSKSAVDRFLGRLETETMIERKAGHGKLIITICNYDKYQDREREGRDSSGTASGTAAGQQRDTKEQGNKRTREPNGSLPPTPQHTTMRDWPEIPDWIPVKEWNAFIAMRKRRARGSMPTAHAVGLMIGKLERWRASGQDPGAILDQSTEAQWTGIFELKDQGNGRQHAGASSGNYGIDRRDGFERSLDEELGLGPG